MGVEVCVSPALISRGVLPLGFGAGEHRSPGCLSMGGGRGRTSRLVLWGEMDVASSLACIGGIAEGVFVPDFFAPTDEKVGCFLRFCVSKHALDFASIYLSLSRPRR